MVLKAVWPKTLVALLPALLCACADLAQHPSPPAAAPPPAVAPAAPRTRATAPLAEPSRGPPATALLLPLSGPFALAAESLRDGFLASYFDDAAHPRLRIYDVGASADGLRAAYQSALRDGANFIVGPMRKEDVALLAGLAPPVPVLGLNYLDTGTAAPADFFQLGLAPEDEALAAARQAGAQGLHRAVALVPDAEWGGRALAAFNAGLHADGGAVVAAQHYRQGEYDRSKAIASLMGVDASEERHRALTAVLGEKSEFEPGRRADIDLIFIAARAEDARMLVPQLRFNRAGELPIYATALVYDGRPSADLNGLRFCDAPWIIDQTDELRRQRSAAALPAANPRLFALGRDAYALSTGLAQNRMQIGQPFNGASGRLAWRGQGVIGRELSCVRMDGDGLRALAP